MTNLWPKDMDEKELFEHHRFKIAPGQHPERIDKYMINHLPKVSRNKFKLAAKAGSIKVNDKPVKPSYQVKPGDIISILLAAPPHDFELLPEKMKLDIIFEDDTLLIVNKPAGMVVHPGSGNFQGTLVNGLLYYINDLPLNNDNRPGLVHRIDKNTSGLLVVAKNDFVMAHLANQFFEKTIERVYVALAWGDFEHDKGTINANIGRHQRHRKKMDVFPAGEQGKNAVTHYKVIKRYHYVTLLECTLETGRTHQIRVHMKHAGHPLFNDDVYGGDKIVKGTIYSKYKAFVSGCFKTMPRQALHAKTLGFIHPVSQKKVFFDSDLPRDFKEILNQWDKYTAALS